MQKRWRRWRRSDRCNLIVLTCWLALLKYSLKPAKAIYRYRGFSRFAICRY